MPRHIEQALSATAEATPLASATIGDARHFDFAEASFAAVLVMGPLYHIIEHSDRILVLKKALRVLDLGGVVFAAAIARYASALDGLHSGFIDDPRFREIVDRDLTDGRHHNPTDDLRHFTTAFFHHPDELCNEVGQAGFTDVEVLSVEGISWASPDLEER